MDYFTDMYGADAFDDPHNWIDGEFKPRKRIARDREALTVPMQFMDAASTQCGGSRPGYAFADTTPPRTAQGAAAEAYDERTKRMENAWRKNNGNDAEHAPLPAPDAAQARALAARAYEDKKHRLQNAWRNR